MTKPVARAEESPHGEIRNAVWGGVAGSAAQVGTVHGGLHFHDGNAGGRPLVPRQLPLPPAHFVGRAPELAELDNAAALRGNRRGLLLITGTGGLGKTALALSWAQLTTAQFPDGQLYADLAAFDPAGPAAPGEILGQFLRALGVAFDRVPPTEAEQAALFRSIVADRRLLVLLDNAASASQVRPMLPAGEGCLVVVTTRWRLTELVNDGAQFLPIEPLAEQAATELLRQILDARRIDNDATATASLVRLCGGLPLALSVTAARLAAHPGWSVRRVTDELSDQRERLAMLGTGENHSVEATLNLSYRALPAEAARCYRALGLHPGAQAGAAVLAAALDMPPPHARRLLDLLVEASLLDECPDERYQLHDLLRLHANQLAREDPQHEVMAAQMAMWYLASVRGAGLVLTPYQRRTGDSYGSTVVFADRRSALEWLERERVNLVATVIAGATTMPELAWHIAHDMWPLFHYHRHHTDRMTVDRVALQCARSLGNTNYEARTLRRWAFAHVHIGQLDEAGRLLETSAALCQQLPDRYGQAAALDGLGTVALARRWFQEASDYFAEALAIFEDLGERRRVARALVNLGAAGNAGGRPDQALVHLNRATTIFAELGDVDLYYAAWTRIELGRALVGVGRQTDGMRELSLALTDMLRLDAPHGRAHACRALGELSLAAGEVSVARARLAEALQIYEQLGYAEANEVRTLLALIPTAKSDPDRIP
jgi:tetratricopeptide (TPR) repeat protein